MLLTFPAYLTHLKTFYLVAMVRKVLGLNFMKDKHRCSKPPPFANCVVACSFSFLYPYPFLYPYDHCS